MDFANFRSQCVILSFSYSTQCNISTMTATRRSQAHKLQSYYIIGQVIILMFTCFYCKRWTRIDFFSLKSQLKSSSFTFSPPHTVTTLCSDLYWGGGIPLASQVRVASSSMESTGINKSPGSILHRGPWNDPLSRQSVGEKHSDSLSIRAETRWHENKSWENHNN